jgi:hypothetical protein
MRLPLLVLVTAFSLAAAPGFQIHLKPEVRNVPVDGRLIVVVSQNLQGEPRFQVTWDFRRSRSSVWTLMAGILEIR